MDKWLLSKFNSLIKLVSDRIENYDLITASREITEFVDELSNWYVRRSRERYWGSEETPDKIAAYKTLYEVLVGLSKLIAPFVPFISEQIYQNLVCSLDKNAPESVHFCAYPEADESFIDEKLNKDMEELLEIVILGRACRSTCGVKNRQPLSKAIICSAQEKNLDQELIDLIKDELNVEDVIFEHKSTDYVDYELKPQLKTLGPKYGKLLGQIREYLSKCDTLSAV